MSASFHERATSLAAEGKAVVNDARARLLPILEQADAIVAELEAQGIGVRVELNKHVRARPSDITLTADWRFVL